MTVMRTENPLTDCCHRSRRDRLSDHAAVQRLAREQLLGETRERRPMLGEETLRPLVLRRDDACTSLSIVSRVCGVRLRGPAQSARESDGGSGQQREDRTTAYREAV